jgi:hypothetical protein
VLRPVGSRPATVYWVRRIVALVAVLVVFLLLAHACGGSGGSDGGQRPAAGGSTPTPTPSTSTSARPPQHHTRLLACTRRHLHVTASTDAATYPAGVEPQLRAVVRNSGPACRYDPAPAQRSWRILSGTDQVWTTDDCRRSGQASTVRLAARHTFSYALAWDRHRSVKGCKSPGAAVQAGTYRLYVTVMGAASRPAVFHLAG